MHFDEDAVHTYRGACARQRLDEFRSPPARFPFSAGQLHRMGRVEHDWVPKLAHYGERTHIHDEILIAEGCSPFRENDLLVSGACDLCGGIANLPRRDELAFLDINGAARIPGGYEQVRLAAEKRGDLQYIANLCCRRNVRGS